VLQWTALFIGIECNLRPPRWRGAVERAQGGLLYGQGVMMCCCCRGALWQYSQGEVLELLSREGWRDQLPDDLQALLEKRSATAVPLMPCDVW
jgi:hypothetical protein